MLDLAIRNGVIHDGTGLPGYRGSIGVRDGKIAAVGAVGEARRELDAGGRVIAPGFIDPHTHFDAQLCWDPFATPSLEHGVTTVVPGNCSLTLAPLRAAQRDRLVRMFRQIEEMPKGAFDDGVDWQWESFEGYLDTLRSNLAINVAPLIGHSALRMWVMGEEAHSRAAKPDEIKALQDLLRVCLDAGGVGLSTSYIDIDENFAPVPSRFAEFTELDALCAVLGERGRMLQVVPEFYDADLNLARVDVLADLSLRHGIPTTFSPLFQNQTTPQMPARVIERVEQQMARGARVWPQVQTRPIDVSFSLEQRSLMFIRYPTWVMLLSIPDLEERCARIAESRDGMVAEVEAASAASPVSFDFGGVRVRETALEKNHGLRGKTLAELAEERGTSPIGAMLDLSIEEGLLTSFLSANMGHCDDEKVAWMLSHPVVHVGASDAGAHVASFATYGDTGYLMSNFVRKTGALRLEEAIKKITLDTARIWGLEDRGQLRPGLAADVVVFDPETIDRGPEIPARDLPGQGFRYIRHGVGIEHTVVNGEVVYSSDAGYSEARPGRVLPG